MRPKACWAESIPSPSSGEAKSKQGLDSGAPRSTPVSIRPSLRASLRPKEFLRQALPDKRRLRQGNKTYDLLIRTYLITSSRGGAWNLGWIYYKRGCMPGARDILAFTNSSTFQRRQLKVLESEDAREAGRRKEPGLSTWSRRYDYTATTRPAQKQVTPTYPSVGPRSLRSTSAAAKERPRY
jgi:hypothetical protein